MFGKLKNLFGGDSGIEVTAPVAGKVVALEDVPDPTFAQGILGPGIAIEPAEGRIVAPADGTVDVMFETGQKNGRYKGIYHVEMITGYIFYGFDGNGKAELGIQWATGDEKYYPMGQMVGRP